MLKENRTDDEARTVLVADHEVLVRHAICEYLRHCGYSVIEASTTDEARTALGEPGLRVDVVLAAADCRGSMNPFEFRQWTGQERPGLSVILAGNLEKSADAAADLCEEGPHLARPYDPSLVVARIKQFIAERARNDTG